MGLGKGCKAGAEREARAIVDCDCELEESRKDACFEYRYLTPYGLKGIYCKPESRPRTRTEGGRYRGEEGVDLTSL